MAIEFNCPYCVAVIRVPDAFSGKKGSCPKCGTKLLVPIIGRPAGQPTDSVQMSPDASEEAADPGLAVTPQVAVTSLSSAEMRKNPMPGGAAGVLVGTPDNVPVKSEVPVFVATKTTTSVSRRLKKNKRCGRSRQLYSVGIPVVCFLLFFVVVAVVMNLQQPELKGTLRGAKAIAMEIPSVSFPLADFALTEDERLRTESAFGIDSESFVSSQMTCRVVIDGSNLLAKVAIGEEFSWYTVNPVGDLTLNDWIRKNQAVLNTDRMKRIVKAGSELCKDKIRKAAGEPVVFDAELCRDGFALNTHVKAFGYVVEAVAGKRKAVCAHEDNNGTLYFALPKNTKSFVLRGRSVGEAVLFPGEYQVEVIGQQKLPSPATEEHESSMSSGTLDQTPGEQSADPPAIETTDVTLQIMSDDMN